MAPAADNPTGYWESTSLAQLNDQLLRRLGGSWAAVPALRADWANSRRVRDLHREATRSFHAVFGDDPGWLWKDPRVSVLLPFWRRFVDPVGVLVWRDPREVAASLARRDHFSYELGLAIWERTTRLVLRDSASMPLTIVRYADLLSDPESWLSGIHHFLRTSGIEVGDQPAPGASAHLDHSLRRARPIGNRATSARDQARAVDELCDLLDALEGPHARFTAPRLPAESSTTNKVLAAHRVAGATGLRASVIGLRKRAWPIVDRVGSLRPGIRQRPHLHREVTT